MGSLLAQWGSWSDFWAMRGYALYVWGSYGVTLALMLLEPWLVARHRRRALAAAALPANEDASS
ncbi:MAG: heme exporter protein CcmD [Burkholderiaceae bacterium]